MNQLVTPEFLLTKLTTNPQRVIGRALLAIYNRQTSDEQSGGSTTYLNGIGFTAFDANLGTRCAKYFAENGQLKEWMVKCWLKPTGKKQQPKILKYTKQLNQIANQNGISTNKKSAAGI